MVKLSRCKEILKEYKEFILISSGILLSLVAVASTIHHLITIISVFFLAAVCVYFLIK